MKEAQVRKINHMNTAEKHEMISRSLTAWTHTYHKPYKADWGEARAKAKERRWDLMNATR
jgi:hypothetical protein